MGRDSTWPLTFGKVAVTGHHVPSQISLNKPLS